MYTARGTASVDLKLKMAVDSQARNCCSRESLELSLTAMVPGSPHLVPMVALLIQDEVAELRARAVRSKSESWPTPEVLVPGALRCVG